VRHMIDGSLFTGHIYRFRCAIELRKDAFVESVEA
jgi:hypothetical protein